MRSINRYAGVFAAAAVLGFGFGAVCADAGTIDRLKQDKTLRLAVRADAPPFSFTDASGAPAGFIVDLCRAVGKHLGAQLNLGDLKIEYLPVTGADRFDAIEKGKADLLCDPTSVTLSRRAQVDFSIATFVDGAGLLVGDARITDFGSLAGQKIGVLAGTTTEKDLRATLASAKINAEVVPAKTHEEGMDMLERGQLAAYFADRAILAFLTAKAKDPSRLRLADNYFSVEPYALALPHGDSDFRLEVDRALSHIYRSGELPPIFAHTFGNNFHPSNLLETLYLVSGLPD